MDGHSLDLSKLPVFRPPPHFYGVFAGFEPPDAPIDCCGKDAPADGCSLRWAEQRDTYDISVNIHAGSKQILIIVAVAMCENGAKFQFARSGCHVQFVELAGRGFCKVNLP